MVFPQHSEALHSSWLQNAKKEWFISILWCFALWTQANRNLNLNTDITFSDNHIECATNQTMKYTVVGSSKLTKELKPLLIPTLALCSVVCQVGLRYISHEDSCKTSARLRLVGRTSARLRLSVSLVRMIPCGNQVSVLYIYIWNSIVFYSISFFFLQDLSFFSKKAVPCQQRLSHTHTVGVHKTERIKSTRLRRNKFSSPVFERGWRIEAIRTCTFQAQQCWRLCIMM